MEQEPQDSFMSHLVELRNRLVRAVIALLVVFVCLVPWSSEIYDLLASPMLSSLPEGTRMIATGVVTPIFVPLKLTMLVALVLALPYILYQAWAFVAPGLYAHERRFAAPLIVGATVLFVCGMAFCYFFVFGTVFKVIYSMAPKTITVAPDIEQYLSFVMTMFLAFGVTFEVPIAVVLLVKTGLVSVAKLREWRSYVIVGAFIVAAVVTPPDVVSQLMLAIPMCLLFELGLLIAAMIERKPAVERV